MHTSCLWVDICSHISDSQALEGSSTVTSSSHPDPVLILGYPACFILSSAKQGLLSCPEHHQSEKTHMSQTLSENGWRGRVLEAKRALPSGGGTSENADIRNRP